MGIQERKEREKEQRKAQILEASEKLFIQKGLQSATMDEIANICELSKGTLYLYYKSKEELFIHLLVKAASTFLDMLKKSIDKASTFEEKFGALGESYLQFYKKYPTYYKIMNHIDEHNYGSSDSSNPKYMHDLECNYELASKTQEIWRTVVGVIEEGVKKGFLRKDINPFEIAITFWTTSNGIMQVMDHMRTYHKNKFKFNSKNDEKDTFRFLHEFSQIDYESVLFKTWEIIYANIRAKKNDNKKQR